MEKKSLSVNFFYQLMNKGVAILIPLVLTPYITRVLSSDALGVYTYSNTVASYFVTFILMGMSLYGSKAISTNQKDTEALSTVYSTLLTIQILNSAVAISAYLLYMQVRPIENRAIFWIQLLYVLSATVDFSWFFAGIENFKGMSIRNMVVNVVSAICIVLFVHHEGDLWVYTLIKAGSILVSQLCLAIPILMRYSYHFPSWRELVRGYRGLLVLFIPVLADTIFQTMDRVMLVEQYSYTAAGIYYASRMVTDIPQTFITSFNSILFPRVTSLVANGEERKARQLFWDSTAWMMVVCIAMAFGIRAIAMDFVSVFFGNSYQEVATVLPVLVVYICLAAWTGGLRYQYLLPHSLERYYVLAILIGIAVNLLLNVVLIPSWGVMGAVVATLVGEMVIAIIEMIPVWKVLNFKKMLPPIIAAFVSGFIMEFAVKGVHTSFHTTLSILPLVLVEIGVGMIVFGLLMSGYVIGFNREMLNMIRRTSHD